MLIVRVSGHCRHRRRRGGLVWLDISLDPFLGGNHLDRVVVFLQSDQCGLPEESGWSDEKHRDSQADASALNWFRHGATVTVLAGIVLYLTCIPRAEPARSRWESAGLLGIIMMANVHAIIWPNQKKIIAAVTAAAEGRPPPPRWPSGVEPRSGFSCQFHAVDSHAVIHGGREPPQVILEQGGSGPVVSKDSGPDLLFRLPQMVRFSYEFPLGRILLGPWS